MTTWSNILIEAGVLALDFTCVALLNKWLSSLTSSASNVKNARNVSIGPELLEALKSAEGQTISYACVSGEVNPVGTTLHSRYGNNLEGVMQQISLVEHKSKRVQGYWSDIKNVLRETLDQVPFYLTAVQQTVSDVAEMSGDDMAATKLYVTDPTEASYLLDNLTTTYDQFDAYNSGVLQRGVDRLFGDVPRGLHETEKMLLNKTILLGFGQIILEGKKIILRPPENGALYILTKLSKKEILNKLEQSNKFVRVLQFIFGVIGCAIAVHLFSRLYQKYKVWRAENQIQLEIEELRNRRVAHLDEDENDSTANEDLCIVCLTNPREVVILECGHICLCHACIVSLPNPRKCPVCRQNVDRYIPVYRP